MCVLFCLHVDESKHCIAYMCSFCMCVSGGVGGGGVGVLQGIWLQVRLLALEAYVNNLTHVGVWAAIREYVFLFLSG